jgi:AraC-like DNA-binding protein
MATNSFARLFKSLMQQTVQQYIQQKRIEKAIKLLHYSYMEIGEIASECGYYDRHHFSKVFKKQTGLSPARYRHRLSGIVVNPYQSRDSGSD